MSRLRTRYFHCHVVTVRVKLWALSNYQMSTVASYTNLVLYLSDDLALQRQSKTLIVGTNRSVSVYGCSANSRNNAQSLKFYIHTCKDAYFENMLVGS